MDSLLATYASSSSDDDDDEEAAEQQRRHHHHHHSKPPPSSSSSSSSSKPNTLSLPPPANSSSSSTSSSSFFTSLPPPKLPPSSSSTSASSFFTSLPPPKLPSSSSSPPPPMALQSATSELPSRLPLPPSKKIVQFRPAIFDAKFVHEDDDDEEDKARAALKKKSSSTVISSSNLSSLLPPPKTSLRSSFSSSRKSSVDNQSNHLPAPRVSTEPVVTETPISLAPTEIDVSSFRNQERTADAVVAEPSLGFEGNPEDEGNLDPDQQSYQEYYYNYYYANQGAVEGKAEYDTWAGDASAVEGVSIIGDGKERKRGRNDIAEKVIEVNQEELMKNRPRQDQVRLTGIAFGQDHQPSTGSWKPSKLHKRKHQIGSLFFDMKQKATELTERRAKGLLTKAQTQGKYGW